MSVKVQKYPSAQNPDKYEKYSFEYTVSHSSGAAFSVINYGASITSLLVPDRDGNFADVVLGHSELDKYMASGSLHGAAVGRCANRTKGAQFALNGTIYQMPKNDGENNLHGGNPSYQNVFWEGSVIPNAEAKDLLDETGVAHSFAIDGDAVLFRYLSPDGECGLPGNLHSEILYAWTSDMTLLIVYTGKSDQDTVFSPTNHSYFNLAGEGSGSTENHMLFINADRITRKSEDNVPDGTFSDVEGTVFDFTVPSPIGKTIRSDHPQLVMSRGMDQNFCLNTGGDVNAISAILIEPSSGRKMEVLTNFPGIQVYTGNHLEGSQSKIGGVYVNNGGVCLETQLFPDAVHHSNFPSAVIPAKKRVCYLTGYRFFAQ